MPDSEWGELTARFVTRLREEKTEPVPAAIVRLAQQSLDGIPFPDDPERVMHAMQIDGSLLGWDEAKAEAFVRHMRNAGMHTNPVSSVTVVRDPERKKVPALKEDGTPLLSQDGSPVMTWGPPVNPLLIAFRAGKRRGKTGG